MNRTVIYAIATATFLAFAGVASADEISGHIAAIDTETQTLTLDNGMSFKLSDDVDIEGLATGEVVKVTFEKQESGNVATGVERPEN